MLKLVVGQIILNLLIHFMSYLCSIISQLRVEIDKGKNTSRCYDTCHDIVDTCGCHIGLKAVEQGK